MPAQQGRGQGSHARLHPILLLLLTYLTNLELMHEVAPLLLQVWMFEPYFFWHLRCSETREQYTIVSIKATVRWINGIRTAKSAAAKNRRSERAIVTSRAALTPWPP